MDTHVCFCGKILMCSSVIAMQHAAVSLSLSLSLSLSAEKTTSILSTHFTAVPQSEGGSENKKEGEAVRTRERQGKKGGGGR